MKNTNPIFSLKNFRSFGEEGADFELAPITVLTGCNSAGKSSLVKALMLLSRQSIVKGGKTDFYPGDPEDHIDSDRMDAGADVVRNEPSKELIVSAKEFGLGRFDKVLNHYTQQEEICITYAIWSRFLQEKLIVKRTYKANTSILNDGTLNKLSIEKEDGTTIYMYYYNKKQITVIGMDGETWYTIGWDEKFNMDSVLKKCNLYIDAKKYHILVKEQKRIESFLSQWKKEDLNDKKKERYEKIEKALKKGKARMQEIRALWGDKIDDFLMSDDWKATWPKSERKPESRLDIELQSKYWTEEEQKQHTHLREQNNIYNLVINECVFPWFFNNIAYVDSSSAVVRRLYSVEDENKMCVALGKLVKKGGKTGGFVNKWLDKFGIADSIEVVGTAEGIGIMVYLIRGNEKCLLADEGYGITQLVSLFLQMENTIIENTRSRTITDPETYEETYEYYYIHSFIAIEEPEIHLHPKYQSLLADMFVEAYQKYNIHFIIETHSEYLIRKLQVLVADKENKLTPNDVSLNYVDKDENGISTNRKIEILEDGRLSEPFGPGFFDEADSLAMDLMKFKVRR